MISNITNEKASPERVGKVIKEASTNKNVDVFIYVGPTVKPLTRYALFVGGLPKHMDEHFEKCKVLKKLFIETKDFAEFEKQLADASSVEAMLFSKVQDYFKSEVK